MIKEAPETFRPIEIEEITKMLACAKPVLGGKEYCCEKSDCPHQKYRYFTCSIRACSSCGKKSTDNWITQQVNRLPDCHWQHMTFTMPDVFWELFFNNRVLLDKICQLAVDNLLYAAKKRGLTIGIFCAIHTYGRRLTWHPHAHASVTLGGLDEDGKWHAIEFFHEKVEQRWRHNLCDFLLAEYENLNIDQTQYRDFDEWRRFVNGQRKRFWHVHFTQLTKDPNSTINYLGRYLKRPPISGMRLSHYRGEPTLSFNYLNHRTGEYEEEHLTQEELIRRIVQHIPEKGFKMIRYYGFLANRVVGNLLGKVRAALGMKKLTPVARLRYGQMIKSFLNQDPFTCVLCGGRMIFRRFIAGKGRKKLIEEAFSNY